MTAAISSGAKLATLARRHLLHTCTLTPIGSTSVDADNQPIVAPGVAVPLVPCRFQDQDLELLISAREAGVERVDAVALFAPEAPVAESARMTTIANARGEALAPGAFVVTKVLAPRLDSSAFRLATLEQLS